MGMLAGYAQRGRMGGGWEGQTHCVHHWDVTDLCCQNAELSVLIATTWPYTFY